MMGSQTTVQKHNFLSLPYFSNLNFLKIQSILFFLIVFLIPTQLGKHFWPDFTYIFSLKIDYFSPTIYFWDLLVIILILLSIFSKRSINKSALTILLIFLLLQLPSIFISENIGASLVRFYQYSVTGSFGVYIASQSFKSIRKPIYFGIICGVITQATIAFLEFIFGTSLNIWLLGERMFNISTPSIATFNFYGQVFLRPYGTTSHPNILAGYFVIMSIFLIFFVNQNFYKKLSIATLFISFFITILTFSRGAIIAQIAGMFFFLRSFKKVILLLLIFLPFIFVRFSSAFNFDVISLQRRNDLAISAFQLFINSPIFGVGLNNYINQMAISDLVSGPSRFLQPVHNIFLLTLSETGIIGMVGFLILLTPFFLTAKHYFLTKKNSPQNVAIISCLLGISFLGFFDHYFLTIPTGQRLLFFCWGLSMLEYFRWKH